MASFFFVNLRILFSQLSQILHDSGGKSKFFSAGGDGFACGHCGDKDVLPNTGVLGKGPRGLGGKGQCAETDGQLKVWQYPLLPPTDRYIIQ